MASFSAMRSAAELLGAQAKILVSGFWRSSCRIPSTMVTVFPVPGLENALGDDSDQKSVKCLRAENAERWGTLRKPQDGRDGLHLRRVACDIRVVNHSS